MSDTEMSGGNQTSISEADSEPTRPANYSNKPAWYSLALLYSLPVWFLFAMMYMLVAVTEFCFFLNFNLVVVTGYQILLAPFIICPLLLAVWLSQNRGWFVVHLGPAMFVWLMIIWGGDVTQGAMNSMLDRAMAIPGRGKNMYEERVPYNQRKPEDRHW